MKKTIILITLTFVVIFFITACGNNISKKSSPLKKSFSSEVTEIFESSQPETSADIMEISGVTSDITTAESLPSEIDSRYPNENKNQDTTLTNHKWKLGEPASFKYLMYGSIPSEIKITVTPYDEGYGYFIWINIDGKETTVYTDQTSDNMIQTTNLYKNDTTQELVVNTIVNGKNIEEIFSFDGENIIKK